MEVKKIVSGLVGGFILSFLVASGFFYFQTPTQSKDNQPQQSVEQEITPITKDSEKKETSEPSLTPTPAKEVKKEDLSIQILNGNGRPGAAREAKDIFQEKGYATSDEGLISADNADYFGYQQTEVYVKRDYKGILKDLVDDLENDYDLDVQTDYLDEDLEYDLRIILGAS